MSTRSELRLAASFIATFAATGCKEGPRGSDHYSPPHLFQSDDGTCRYMHGFGCPADATCNPPGPMAAECPPEMRDGGPPSDPLAAERPGWVRLKESVGAYQGHCSFMPDHFCPMPGKGEGSCETATPVTLACQFIGPDAGTVPDGGQPGWHRIEAFTAARAGGRCVKYGAFWCDPSCTLPPGQLVDCATGAPLGPEVTPVASALPTAPATIATEAPPAPE